MTRTCPAGSKPRIAALLLALLAASSPLAGCSDLVSGGVGYGSIEVQVVDRSGEPVPGTRLYLYTGQRDMAYGRTDGQGRHTFQFVPRFDSYGVFAEPPPEYAIPPWWGPPHVDAIDLTNTPQVEIEFEVLKIGTGSVEVVTVDTAGAPVAGVMVLVSDTAEVLEEGATDEDGLVIFDEISFGRRFVRLGEGHVAASGESEFEVVVDAGSHETFRFTVEPEPEVTEPAPAAAMVRHRRF